jgi:Flp pilus assembly protein TadG
MHKLRHKISRLLHKRDGSAAIEFALLILPFSILIFVIIEISLLYFVDTSLDNALHQTARKIKVGYAAQNKWTIDSFKADLCNNMALSFGCSSHIIVRVAAVNSLSSASYISGTTNGVLTATDSYDMGKTGDYILVQAFLPWDPVFKLYTFSSATLSDGTYILGASALFKNEPF